MSDELRRLRQQQDANAAAIQRMQMQQQYNNARRQEQTEEEVEHVHQPQYNTVDQQAMHLQQIAQHAANQAAQQAAQQATHNMQAYSQAEKQVKDRMERLVANYPALTQEDSLLVVKARDSYARIAAENPGLDEASRYEMAVLDAASLIGARPVNAPIEDYAAQDYVMPAGRNPAMGSPRASGRTRLNTPIIQNAKLLGINVDPATPEGKKNLAELNEYTIRFNADQDESPFRYK